MITFRYLINFKDSPLYFAQIGRVDGHIANCIDRSYILLCVRVCARVCMCVHARVCDNCKILLLPCVYAGDVDVV